MLMDPLAPMQRASPTATTPPMPTPPMRALQQGFSPREYHPTSAPHEPLLDLHKEPSSRTRYHLDYANSRSSAHSSSAGSLSSMRSGASSRHGYPLTPPAGSLDIAEPGAFGEGAHPREDGFRPPSLNQMNPPMVLPPLKRPGSPAAFDPRPTSRRLATMSVASPSITEFSSFRAQGRVPIDCHLRIRQQPEAARACGFGERDRRVIDPPPVLELEAIDSCGNVSDIEELQLSLYVVHASLWSEDGSTDLTGFMQPPGKPARRLVGSLAASPAVATDEQNRRGSFFTFADLSCRETGNYRLRFTLVRVDPSNTGAGATAPVLASLLSDVFRVYTPKDFPGMRRSTPLTQALKIQGVAIPAKKGRSGPFSRLGQNSGSQSRQDDWNRGYEVDRRDVVPHYGPRDF